MWRTAVVLGLVAGCEHPPPPAPAAASAGASPVAPAASAASAAQGSSGLGLPAVALSAQPGQRVLAPAASALEGAEQSRRALPYYAGRLIEIGAESSVIESAAGNRAAIPNVLIVPLGPNDAARAGELVLTAWASGAGLSRAVVVSGDPATPSVRYVDLPQGSAAAARLETLPAGSFRRVAEPGDVGSSLACGDARSPEHFILIRRLAEQLIVLGHGDRVTLVDRASCQDVPIAPRLAPGAVLRVPVAGQFRTARITKLDPKLGLLTARYETAGGPVSAAFGYGNVLPGAPPP